MLSPQQITEIKKQLSAQIEKSFPEDKKEFAKKQIQEMNSEQLEEFLKQNKLTVQERGGLASEGGQCIFCAITSGKMDSFKIAENREAIAVLELNPVSRGHVIILPRKHISSYKEISEEIKKLAKKVSKRLKSKLKAKKVLMENSNLFGHEIINLIPIYEGKPIEKNQERKPASKEALSQLQKTLKEKPKPLQRKPKTIKIKPEEKIRLPKRIP